MNKVDGALKGLAPSGNLITRTFEFLGNVLSSVGREILNVAEFALGHILGDAIEFVVGKIGELISATIQAGAEFQTMSLRLNRLNLNDIAEAALDYVDAGEAAANATQEQLKWIQRLAVQTPYDAQDIANVYTLARSYGVADEQARGMTEDIADFAAGMGLGNTEIERIVVNFGQMIQQGKVTQREMNDLARGAFVPVNDVLERMQENTGLTDQAFKDFRQTGEGVQAFFEAFSQIVDERFQGAAQDMARTFQGATANAQDFVKSLLGMGVVKPVLDAVGGKIADMINSLTTEANWDALVEATGKVGDGLSDLVGTILNGFIPSTGDLAGNIISGMENFSGWIEEHRPDILGFFQGLSDIISDIAGGVLGISMPKFDVPGAGLGDSMMEIQGNTPKTPQFLEDIRAFINDKVIPAIDNLKKTFDTISGWVDENGSTIKEFFGTLGDIVGQVFDDLSGGGGGGESGLDKLLSGITNFMTYVIENKDAIIPLVENLIKLFAAVQVGGFVFGVLLNIFLAILSPILALAAIVTGILAIFATGLVPTILIVIGVIAGLIAIAGALYLAWKNNFGGIQKVVAGIWDRLRPIFEQIGTTIEKVKPQFIAAWEIMKEAVINFWNAIAPILGLILAVVIGVIVGIVQGIIQGASYFLQVAGFLATGLSNLISGIIDIVSGLLNIIVGIFTLNGDLIMEGLSLVWQGILEILGGTFELIVGIIVGALALIIGVIQGFVAGVIGFFTDLYNQLVGQSIVVDLVYGILGLFQLLWDETITKLTGMVEAGKAKFEEFRVAAIAKIVEFVTGVVNHFKDLLSKIKAHIQDIIKAWTSVNWFDIGVSIMDGIKRGIISMVQTLIDQIVHAAQAMYDAAMAVIGAHSPSKLFMNVGTAAMEGMAKGIQQMSGMVAATMEQAVAGMAMPAMSLPAMTAGAASSAAPGVTNSTQNSYNYNLTVNSSSPTEPIVQDYNMMRALAT